MLFGTPQFLVKGSWIFIKLSKLTSMVLWLKVSDIKSNKTVLMLKSIFQSVDMKYNEILYLQYF